MSAERGWIVDPPPPPTEWHTPGWVKEGGRHFITPPGVRRIAAPEKPPYPQCPHCPNEWHGLPTDRCKGSWTTDDA